MMQFRLIYPERRTVSAEQIISWYADALANQQVTSDFVKSDGVYAAVEMAKMLEDIGFITVGEVYADGLPPMNADQLAALAAFNQM